VLLAATAVPASAATIRGIRSTVEGDSTRIIIEVSETTPYKWALVPADSAKGLAPRFYVDIEGVRVPASQNLDFTVGDGRVRQVRAGQNAAGRARVVLDLLGPFKPTVFALQSPARIVIDLAGKPTAAPDSPGTTQTASAARPQAPPGQQLASVVPVPSARPGAMPTPARTPLATTARVPTHPAPIGIAKARKVRVVLDPGHGGRDPGAKSSAGVVEKDITLDIAKRLASKLKDRLGFEVFLTRQTDQYVSLGSRKDMANRLDADLFVSIHANAHKSKRLAGIETYYLKNSNDRATLRLANLENGVDMLIGSDVSTDADLDYIVSDLIQGQKEADSIRAARHLQQSIVGTIKPRYTEIEDLGVKQGPFLVLDGTFMAAVLVETGFVTNSTEAKRLASGTYRDAIADGLYNGIKRYFEDDRTALLR
jgi:N-acetylmuramoyl-L-alanine amidase